MRILVLSRWFPWPADNGSKIRISNLIAQLAARHRLTLISFFEGQDPRCDLDSASGYCEEVHTVPYRPFNPRRWSALAGVLSPRPRSMVDIFSAEMANHVKDALAKERFDVILASENESILYVPRRCDCAKVLEDIELAVFRDQYALQERLLPRIRYGLTWWKFSRFLGRRLQNFDGCTVVSRPEADLVRMALPSCPTMAVVPNAVDLDHLSGSFGRPDPESIIFSGALTYQANYDAMAFFLGDVLPRIHRRNPNVHLKITGRHDGVPVDRLPMRSNVEWTGYLDDVRPAVAQSAVCVVPLRQGAGTRIKILEAMALKTPVVATSKGAEGLEVVHDRDLLIADEPEAFAEAVLRILGDADLMRRLVEHGRERVERLYTWERSGQALDDLLVTVTSVPPQISARTLHP